MSVLTTVTENEEPFLPRFRWVLVILDVFYLGLMALQKSGGDFPSPRFESLHRTILVHICCGIIIIYTGCFFHIQNVLSPITVQQDANSSFRHSLYFMISVVTIIHSITVFKMSTKVMGERRLTLPLYIFTGTVNLINAVNLMAHPTLANLLLVWGSMNTFILVRINIFFLLFSNVDWELAYTYSITAAAGVIGPMTNQPRFVYIGYFVALLYAPFHEKVSYIFGWDTEDTLGGNQPSQKNILERTRSLRSSLSLSVRTKSSRSYGSLLEAMAKTGVKDSIEDDDSNDKSEVSDLFSVIQTYAERV